MSEIKHIGAMTLGIIGTNLSGRNEKIKAILESDSSISYNPDFGKELDKDRSSKLMFKNEVSIKND